MWCKRRRRQVEGHGRKSVGPTSIDFDRAPCDCSCRGKGFVRSRFVGTCTLDQNWAQGRFKAAALRWVCDSIRTLLFFFSHCCGVALLQPSELDNELTLLLVDWGALVHRRCHSGCAWFAKDVCHHSDRRLLYNLAIHDELHHADRKGCIRGNLDFRDFGDAVTPQNIVTRTSMCQQNMQCAWHLYVRPLAQPTQIRHSLQSRSHPPQRVGAPSARKPV